MEEQLANQRVKEGEVMMELLYSNVKRAHVQVADVDLHIGALRATLDAEGVSEISLSDDEESIFDVVPASSSESSKTSEDLNNGSDSDNSMYSISRLSCQSLRLLTKACQVSQSNDQSTALTEASLKLL
jgi:hypothetical protein